MRMNAAITCVLLAMGVPAAAAPHLTMDAGLVQEAGVQFFVDPTGLSLRLFAQSTRPLNGLTIRVNNHDLTDLVVRNSRVEVAPDGRSGSLLLERLPLVATGLAPAGQYRIEATVRDEDGATTLAAVLAPAAPRVPFVTLASGAYSGNTSSTRAVVRDAASWETFWRQHTSNMIPPVQSPAVDFATRTVLAVVLGLRPTGGYAVRIVDVRSAAELGPVFVVQVEESSPPPGAIVTQALTSPFHFVTVPRWDGPVRFWVLEEPIR